MKKLKKKPYKIENLEDKFKFVTEAVAGFQESFPRQMAEMEARLQEGTDDTQKALKMTRKVLEERIDKVDAKIDRVGAALEAKIDKVETVLSGKIDHIGEIVTRHEEEITSLKRTA
ncbi:MAG: hypothetical protein HYY44_05970 [Deltaproteobacteria bacterium]|nr:hypothetical protein [Deltaproteobacteria bacterium]